MKFLIRLFLSLAVLALVAVLFLGYLGILPRVSTALGTDKPRDLGVKYDEATIKEAEAKLKVFKKTSESTDDPAQTLSFMGKQKVKNSFSSEELTFFVNDNKWKYYPVSNVQIKMTGNLMEISGFLKTERIIGFVVATGGSKYDIAKILGKIRLALGNIPFYLKGTGSVTNNSPTFNLQRMELGRLSIPQGFINKNMTYIENFAKERIEFVKGANIKSATIAEGKLNFNGTLPEVRGEVE